MLTVLHYLLFAVLIASFALFALALACAGGVYLYQMQKGGTLVAVDEYQQWQRSKRWGLVLLLVSVAVMLVAMAGLFLVEPAYQRQEEGDLADRARQIVKDIEPAIAQCQPKGWERPDFKSLPGKALVWDRERNALSEVFPSLPEKLKASAGDKAMTVFLVVDKTKYEWHVCVITWPDKEAHGNFNVSESGLALWIKESMGVLW
jgi:hypothetical protein